MTTENNPSLTTENPSLTDEQIANLKNALTLEQWKLLDDVLMQVNFRGVDVVNAFALQQFVKIFAPQDQVIKGS